MFRAPDTEKGRQRLEVFSLSYSCWRIPDRPKLLDERTLETSPPELRQALAYVLHLRSCWKPEGGSKLVVPSSWMEFLALAADGKCGMACRADRYCPFRNVRFESIAETRLRIAPVEEVPRDLVSQLLTNIDTVDDRLATFVSRAFEGSPHVGLTRQVSTLAASDVPSQPSTAQRIIDFAIVPKSRADNTFAEDDVRRCLLFGMIKGARSAHSGPSLTLAPILEDLAIHGRSLLALLASLTQKEVIKVAPGSRSFPEWLVLFGLVCNARHVSIVVCVPRRRKSGELDCAAYIVDELALRSPVVSSAPCELVLERLRFLSALTSLRRHVHRLFKSLFAADAGRIKTLPSVPGCSARYRDASNDSKSLEQRASHGSDQGGSSKYSTCPSSIHAHRLGGASAHEELSSLPGSVCSSCCSTCLSPSESSRSSRSTYSEHSKCTQPSARSLSQGDSNKSTSVIRAHKLAQMKRWEITAWARQITPTEHPVRDDYRMVVYNKSLS